MADIFEGRKCTFYRTGRSYEGTNRSILDVLTKEGFTNSILLNKIRNYGYGSDLYKSEKVNLSCATFSSIQKDLNVTHSEDNHLMHTGFIQFDIDAGDNEYLKQPGGLEEIKATLIDKVPYIAYLGTSVSGLGLWGLIPIAYPSRHSQHYAAMLQYFTQFGVKLDSKTSNVAAYRFISYDPDAHFELNPQIFEEYENGTNKTSYVTNPGFYAREIKSEEIFLAACRWVEAKHEIKFVKGSKHNYLVYLCSCLISARVSKDDAEAWIYKNLIPKEEVTTNCISHTYAKYT